MATLPPNPHDGEMAGLSTRQEVQYVALDKVEDLLGQWDQSEGADGAHYGPSPWASRGIRCENCVAYMNSAHACHWVEGEIAPNGICKLWIIPENLITPEGE